MNKETYEALKRIMKTLGKLFDKDKKINDLFEARDLNNIEGWIDEVAKEYEEN